MKKLTRQDFTQATVFACGLDNRDAKRGYLKGRPVQETPISALVQQSSKEVLPPHATNDR